MLAQAGRFGAVGVPWLRGLAVAVVVFLRPNLVSQLVAFGHDAVARSRKSGLA
jgi:hypothetical protein